MVSKTLTGKQAGPAEKLYKRFSVMFQSCSNRFRGQIQIPNEYVIQLHGCETGLASDFKPIHAERKDYCSCWGSRIAEANHSNAMASEVHCPSSCIDLACDSSLPNAGPGLSPARIRSLPLIQGSGFHR